MPKERKVVCYRRIDKLGFFLNGLNESKFFFIRTYLRFYGALAILEPQIYVVVKQFGAENISLLSGRLVKNIESQFSCLETSKHYSVF